MHERELQARIMLRQERAALEGGEKEGHPYSTHTNRGGEIHPVEVNPRWREAWSHHPEDI
jgi:hypothetical protein